MHNLFRQNSNINRTFYLFDLTNTIISIQNFDNHFILNLQIRKIHISVINFRKTKRHFGLNQVTHRDRIHRRVAMQPAEIKPEEIIRTPKNHLAMEIDRSTKKRIAHSKGILLRWKLTKAF